MKRRINDKNLEAQEMRGIYEKKANFAWPTYGRESGYCAPRKYSFSKIWVKIQLRAG